MDDRDKNPDKMSERELRNEVKIRRSEEVPYTFRTDPQPWAITFQNDVGDTVGKLQFDSQGQIEFSGEADKAAMQFFNSVVRTNNERMHELREMLLQGKAVVDDFMPNIANCALQDIGRLNDFLMKADAEEKRDG